MAKGIAHREWRIERDEYQTDQDFRYAVQQEMSLAEHIGERLGVAIVSAPVRTRASEGGMHFTVAWVFQTASIPSASATKLEDSELEALEDALAEPALVDDSLPEAA